MADSNAYQRMLLNEAAAFDNQMRDRFAGGHIPDLRRVGRCEWFYNNPWRDAVYSDMVFGDVVRLICRAATRYLAKPPGEIRLLEIGCGPGHLTLELSRNGYAVTGIDLSAVCIDVARRTAQESPPYAGAGHLDYAVANVYDFVPEAPFDLVVFSGALHHFGNQKAVLAKVERLLAQDGLIFVSEPTRLRLTERDAAIVHLIRGLLTACHGYFQHDALPRTHTAMEQEFRKIRNEFGYKDDENENVQSPLDNEAGYVEMMAALTARFEELERGKDFCFFDRIVGGLRLESREKEGEVARWLQLVDETLCRADAMTPEQFHFLGRRRR